MSMKSTGVRPGRRTTSSFIPGSGWLRHQAATSCTAFSMWPCASHSASKAGDWLGMRMYSTSAGTMLSSQVRVTRALARARSMPGPPGATPQGTMSSKRTPLVAA